MYEQYCTVDGLKFLSYMCDYPINESTVQFMKSVRYKDYRAKIDLSYRIHNIVKCKNCTS